MTVRNELEIDTLRLLSEHDGEFTLQAPRRCEHCSSPLTPLMTNGRLLYDCEQCRELDDSGH